MHNITTDSFSAEVLQSDKRTVVDFYADWCGPCKMIAPYMQSLSEEHREWKFCKINVDENPELAIRFGVSSIPTVAVFENGQLLDTFVGYREKEQIAAFISAC